MNTIPIIEARHKEAGFIYVNNTRMGYCPMSCVKRDLAPRDFEPLAIWRSQGWPEPTTKEVAGCIAVLVRRYPGRSIEMA